MGVLGRDMATLRECRRVAGEATAAKEFGPLVAGREVFAVTNGQISLIDVIGHYLRESGPAELEISTFSAGVVEINHLARLAHEGAVTGVRWVMDRSFVLREPKEWRLLNAKFPAASIRLTVNHAKVATIRNERWAVLIDGSANLQENKRMEVIRVTPDRALVDFWVRVMDGIFDSQPEGQKPKAAARRFARLGLERLPSGALRKTSLARGLRP